MSAPATFLRLPVLRQPQIDWLMRQGVPVCALHRPTVLKTAEVAFLGRYFDFPEDHHSEERLVPAVIVYQREVEDLIAWSPRHGVAAWMSRTGVLGNPNSPRLDIDERRPGEAYPPVPLVVHRNVLEWLRSGREGVVIIDRDQAGRELQDCGPFLAEDILHGLELEAILKVPAPDIRVPAQTLQAAE